MVYTNIYCLDCKHSGFEGPDIVCLLGECEPDYESENEEEDICV